jgi:MFS family permease
MYLTAAVSAIALVLVITLYRRPPSTTTSDDNANIFLIPLKELLTVSTAGLAWAVFNIGFVIYVSFAPNVLTERGLSTTDAGTLASIAVWITIFSVPLGGYLTDRTGWSNAMIVCFSLLTAIVLALFPYLSIPVLLSILIGLSLGPPPGAIVALPSQVLSPSNRSIGFGVFYTWYYIGMAVGPIIAGVGRDVTGSAAVPLLIGAVSFMSVVLFLAMFHLFMGKSAEDKAALAV